MPTDKAQAKLVKAAAHAHTNLNTFAAVAAILEGGTLYHSRSAQATAQKIIQLCEVEGRRQLKAYDRAVLAASPELQSEPKGEQS